MLTAEQFGCLLTKDYLSKTLDERLKDFITKDYLDERLKNFITKDYLDERLKNVITKDYFDKTLDERFKNVISKDYFDQQLDERFGQLDYKIETTFNHFHRSFNNHELRLKRLEPRIL